jgi:hypothetical protein
MAIDDQGATPGDTNGAQPGGAVTEEDNSAAGFSELLDTVRTLECGTIIVVDDNVPDVEAVRAEIVQRDAAPASIAARVAELAGWPQSQESRWDLVERIVDAVPFDERRKLTGAIYAELGKETTGWDSAFAEPLLELRETENAPSVISVSPREWIKHRPDAPATEGEPAGTRIPVTGKAVVLFDYDLSKVEGRRRDEGLKLARDVVTGSESHAIYCGVISQRFNDANFVAGVRQGFGAADRDRLVLVCRREMQDPASLAAQFRRVYRAHSALRLRQLAHDALTAAHNRAMAALADIDVAPLLHVVVDLSYVEGISEFDTIRRLYLVKFGRELDRTELFDRELQDLMRDIRSVPHEQPSIPSAVLDMENEERYAEIALVNRRHLPVELGDVFSIRAAPTASAKKFVLVTHPCDLMVRSGGNRPTLGGQKETTHGVLLPVSDDKLNDPTNGFELPYAKPKQDGKRKSLYVRFRPPLYVPLYVLDLCVFDNEGRSTMKLNAVAPEAVPASIAALHGRLIERTKAVVQSATAPSPAVVEGSPIELRVPEGAIPGISGRATADSIAYDCQRVMRLAPIVASRLLVEYSNYTGREAAAMDLARGA